MYKASSLPAHQHYYYLWLSLGFILVALLQSCAVLTSAPPDGVEAQPGDARPEWLLQPQLYYPAAEYFAEVGSALNTELAQRNARGNIAQIFSTSIRQSTLSGTRVVNNDKDSFGSQFAISTTDEQIVGIEIGALWHDARTGEHYALAYLSRAKYALYLEAELLKLRDQLASLQPGGGDGTQVGNFADARLLYQQLALMPELERLQRHRRVVAAGAANAQPSVNSRSVEQSLAERLAAINLCWQAEVLSPPAANTKPWSQLVRQAALAIGWQIKASGECLDFALNLRTRIAEKRAGWYFSELELDYTLSWQKQILAAGAISLQSSAVLADESSQRLQQQIKDKLAELLLADLLS